MSNFKVGGMRWTSGDGTSGQVFATDGLGNFVWKTVLSAADLGATGPIIFNPVTKTLSIPKADVSHDGFLAATDFTAFTNNIANLASEVTNRTSADAGLQSQINTNSSNISTNTSAIAAETSARTADTANMVKLDGSRSMTGDLNLNTHKVTNLAAPVSANDAARKTDVDAETTARTTAVSTVQTNLNTHTGQVSGAHAASAISNTPAGNVGSTTVQAAINELQTHIDTNTTAIAGKQASGNYVTALTGDVSASGPGSAASTVNSVGGSSATLLHTAEQAANAAASANTASTIVKRDSSSNASINNLNKAFATIATAAGTTTLTIASAAFQQFTGSSTQTVNLPAANTLPTGYQLSITNRSTGVVTVKDGGGSTVQAMAAGTQVILTCSSNGTAAGTWDLNYTFTSTLPIAQGGTGAVTQQAAINALTGTQAAGKFLRSDGTNAALSNIVAGDVPTLNQNTTGTAASITGNLTGDVTSTGMATAVAQVGGQSATSVAAAATAVAGATNSSTASALMKRDGNANVAINNINEAFVTTGTAAGVTTLTLASAPLQQFTGSTTQTVNLPAANTLPTGCQFFFFNRSTGAVTIKDGAGTTLQVMSAGTQATFTCAANGTVAGTWDTSYTYTGTLPVTQGGTGQASFGSGVLKSNGTALSSASIVDADVSASAAISYSKMAALALAKALVSDASGTVSASTVSASELARLSGILSAAVGISDTQTLTNKTHGDAAIFTQIATPTSPSAGFNKIYPKSDGKFYTLNSAGVETAVGSGSGSSGLINYLSNTDAENGSSGWNLFADGSSLVDGTGGSATALFSTTVTNPLTGFKSFIYTPGALGNGVSTDFTVTRNQRGKMQSIEFDYELATYANFTDGDLQVWILPLDGSDTILKQPSTYKIAKASGPAQFSSKFQATIDATSYRLIIYQTTATTTWTSINLDSVRVGPQSSSFTAPAITDWQAYTPGVFNVPSSAAGFPRGSWRRVGDSMEIEISWQSGGVGSGGTIPYWTIPAGYTVDTSVSKAADSTYGGGTVIGQVLLYGWNSGFYTTASAVMYGAGLGIMKPGTGGFYVQSDIPGTAVEMSMMVRVPIAGWGSNLLIGSDAGDGRVVAMKVSGNPTGSLGPSFYDVIFPVTSSAGDFDTHAGYNSSTGVYTIPVSGYYRLTAGIGVTGTYPSNADTDVVFNINSSLNGQGIQRNTSGASLSTTLYPIGTILQKFKAGDTVKVQSYTAATSVAFGGGSNSNFFCVERLAGPSAIAAGESVSAKYYTTAGQSVSSSGTVVNYDQKSWDSHNAVTTGASWKFTAPVAGKYRITGGTSYASAAFTQGNPLQADIFKNGSTDTTNFLRVGATATTSYIVGVTGTVSLNAGEYINIVASHSESAARNMATSAAYNFVTIEKVAN